MKSDHQTPHVLLCVQDRAESRQQPGVRLRLQHVRRRAAFAASISKDSAAMPAGMLASMPASPSRCSLPLAPTGRWVAPETLVQHGGTRYATSFPLR
jgi:hypothetical protein